jgi:hypothetical protein
VGSQVRQRAIDDGYLLEWNIGLSAWSRNEWKFSLPGFADVSFIGQISPVRRFHRQRAKCVGEIHECYKTPLALL